MRKAMAGLAVSMVLVHGVAAAQGKGSPAPPSSAPPSAPAAGPRGEIPIDVQMFRAIDNGCTFSLVELKLKAGADPNAKNEEQGLKIRVGENGLISALRMRCNETTIKVLVTGDAAPGIQTIRVKKADIEAPGLDGVTPLVLAVQTGDVSLVKLLMKAGADADRKMTSSDAKLNGKTAFDFLAGQKHEKRLRRILKKDWD